METEQFSEMTDLKDCKMDLGNSEEEKCRQSEEDERDCLDAYLPECLDTEKSNSPISEGHNNSEAANDCMSSEETHRGANFQEDIMVKDTEKEEADPRKSITSPEPEHQVQDQPVDEGENYNPTTLDANTEEHQESQESKKTQQEDNSPFTLDSNVEEDQEPQESQGTEQEDDSPSGLDSKVEEYEELQDSQKTQREGNSPVALDSNEAECQEPQESSKLEHDEDDCPSKFDANDSEHQDEQENPNSEQEFSQFFVDVSEIELQEVQEGLTIKQGDNGPSSCNVNDRDSQKQQESLPTEPEDNPIVFDTNDSDQQELQDSVKLEQESVLEQQIKELAVSDGSTESCQDNDRDDLSDCVQAEMAIVMSDSDAEEQWKSMYSPVVHKEETGDTSGTGTVDVTEEPNNHEDAIEEDPSGLLEIDVEPLGEALAEMTDSIDILEQPECPTECELDDLSYDGSIHYRSLTKISEDVEDPSQSMKHSLQRLSASTSELDKKLPQDYCVIQEMKNENVSTEHVDFRMACQQWKKMEEQNKGLLSQRMMKQGTGQGGHNFMYTPVRTLERAKKDQDSDSLSLSDYQYTQFSPCSEDSGLDDTSYRSPYDEPETPVEREIRETMEREESFRRERAMSRSPSGESMQSKPRPATLLTSKSDPEERKKMYNTPEDRCRSQRSPSAKTPTLSISSSPSSKPTYHEMVANNVIILEPDSYPTSPRHRGKGLLSPGTNRFHEWPSDMANVIILETSNLIIRSASEFCLSTACQETQESTFHNNPFFKLRSHSTQSLVDQEIKVVRQRDEEFRRQRAQLYAKEKYDTVLVSPSLLDSFTYDRPGEIPAKCKSSPSSPLKVRKMDRSVLSCDQKFYG